MSVVIEPGVTFQGGLSIVGGTPPGQQAFTEPGTYSFVVPNGLTVINAVLIGGGGGATNVLDTSFNRSGGGGGGLRWINRLPVVPGETLEVVVGAGGVSNTHPTAGTAGGSSFIRRVSDQTILVEAGGGRPRTAGIPRGGTGTDFGLGPYGGVVGGGDGGNSSVSLPLGGGGAGGYSGPGGSGEFFSAGFGPPESGQGGGGAGGRENGGGGGVGIFGQGSNGSAANFFAAPGTRGTGGSGGIPVSADVSPSGGLYGGGAGSFRLGAAPAEPYGGAHGAVRIIWGDPRAFPSTNTGDL